MFCVNQGCGVGVGVGVGVPGVWIVAQGRSRSRSPNFLKPWSPGVGVGVGVPQENKDSASLLVTKAFSQDRHCSHSRFPGILVPCLCLTCTILPIHMGVLWNFFFEPVFSAEHLKINRNVATKAGLLFSSR